MQNDFSRWINALKANDSHALENLYTENYPKVEQYILANNGDKDQAKDIFQEAFIVCWRALQEDRFSPRNESSPGGYLYKIAKYKWLDYLRSGHYKKVVPMPDDLEDWEPPTQQTEEEPARLQMMDRFRTLNDSCRDVLTRFYFKKESMKEIAAALGWTEATARNNKYRCIQQLRTIINRI